MPYFLSRLPLEFDDRVRIERDRNGCAAEATVIAVQYHEGHKAVAVRFLGALPVGDTAVNKSDYNIEHSGAGEAQARKLAAGKVGRGPLSVFPIYLALGKQLELRNSLPAGKEESAGETRPGIV